MWSWSPLMHVSHGLPASTARSRRLARLAEVDTQVRWRFRQRARRFLGTSIAAMIWISEIGTRQEIPEEKFKAEVKLCGARIAPQD